nr:unnamed protein product [Callosobruchus chinensis]
MEIDRQSVPEKQGAAVQPPQPQPAHPDGSKSTSSEQQHTRPLSNAFQSPHAESSQSPPHEPQPEHSEREMGHGTTSQTIHPHPATQQHSALPAAATGAHHPQNVVGSSIPHAPAGHMPPGHGVSATQHQPPIISGSQVSPQYVQQYGPSPAQTRGPPPSGHPGYSGYPPPPGPQQQSSPGVYPPSQQQGGLPGHHQPYPPPSQSSYGPSSPQQGLHPYYHHPQPYPPQQHYPLQQPSPQGHLPDTGSSRSFITPTIAERFFRRSIVKDPFKISSAHGTSVEQYSITIPSSNIFNLRDFVKCSLCHLKFHLVCVSMKDSWMRIVINVLKKEIYCLKREQQLTSKILENLEYTNDLQKAVIKSYENQLSSQSCTTVYKIWNYEIVKRPPKCPALVIKSNDNSSNTDLFQEVTKSVDPAQINVCISSTRRIENEMVVHCEDENSVSRLKDSLNHKLGSKFTVSEPRKLNPRLLVENDNLTNLPSAEPIIKDIVILNRLDEEQSSLKFVTKLKHVHCD